MSTFGSISDRFQVDLEQTIAPKVPFLNIIAAVGLEKLLDFSSQLVKIRYFGHLVISGILAVNFLATVLFVAISSLNYPGGDVFSYLHNQHLKCHQEDFRNFFYNTDKF